MNQTKAARTALAFFLSVSVLAGCGSKGGGKAQEPALPSDEVLLGQFVDSEKKLDAAQLSAALGAGADLGKAADSIRTQWEAARLRLLSTLGPKGVVRQSGGSDTTPPRFKLPNWQQKDPGLVAADFDFASMAWATWSLGLLYLGNDASGTSEHGPSTSGDVTTRESTTITAAKRGPVASVKLTITRSQTSRLGWSVSQSASVELTLPLCPDQNGVIAFDMKLNMNTTGSAGNGATSTVTDSIAGHTVATVNDNADLATVAITGSYDHSSSAQGQGLAIAAGDSGIHVSVSGSGVTGNGSGGATDAQVNEARNYGAILLQLAGGLAVARAGDFYKKGYCTEIQVTPDGRPTVVALNATQPFEVKVRHKFDNVELTDKITSQLEGQKTLSPTSRTATPTRLSYGAPNQKNQRATIKIESRSKRGIARKDVAVKTPGGYAIHDVWKYGDVPQNMDGVSCESPYGPWHVKITGDNAANGWASFDAYFDIRLDPNTGKGTLTGEEHSKTTDGQSYDGPSTGTAVLTPDGDNYLIKLEIDFDILWRNPRNPPLPGREHIKGHSSRELHVKGATEQECP
jgi:hypothetical protein